MNKRLRAGKAEIVKLPSRTMAVVRAKGDPEEQAGSVMGALYGAVYSLKFSLRKQGEDYEVEAPRARWSEPSSAPQREQAAEWAIPVPPGTTELQQRIADLPVSIETWDYGTVAQVLHVGPYSEEGPLISKLRDFIDESGYEIAGPHEEEYLSRPGAKEQKTVIRYPVKPKDDGPTS